MNKRKRGCIESPLCDKAFLITTWPEQPFWYCHCHGTHGQQRPAPAAAKVENR